MNADPKQSCSVTTEAEPTAAMTAMPVWLVALMVTLLFLSAWYFDLYGGWFEPKVYAPYASVADVQRFQPKTGGIADTIARGKKLYADNCAVCHMETGVGNPANGCPPLVDSEWVKSPTATRLVMLISKGLSGPITVNGKVYALRHAAAFVDAADARKPTVLVLSDRPLPAKALVSSASLSLERNLNAFSGIALWVDAQRQIFRAE